MEKRIIARKPHVPIDELAAALGLSKAHCYRLAQTHKIPGVKFGQKWYFHVQTVFDTMCKRTSETQTGNDIHDILNTC